jgi:hypothetical protein
VVTSGRRFGLQGCRSLRTLSLSARVEGKFVGFVAKDCYEQWRLATLQLPENFPKERPLPYLGGGSPFSRPSTLLTQLRGIGFLGSSSQEQIGRAAIFPSSPLEGAYPPFHSTLSSTFCALGEKVSNLPAGAVTLMITVWPPTSM